MPILKEGRGNIISKKAGGNKIKTLTLTSRASQDKQFWEAKVLG